MSLYLGRDSAGSNILHITDAVTPESSMKNGILSSTTFHSSLPYVQVIHTTSIPSYKSSIFNGQWTDYAFTALLDTQSIDLINQGYEWDIVVTTRNSGGARVVLSNYSSFSRSSGGSPSTFNVDFGYAYTNSSNPYAGGRSSSPSSSYPFVILKSNIANGSTSGVMYGSGRYNSSDSVYTVELVFYNIRNKNLEYIQSVSSTIITPNVFQITSLSGGVVDFASFRPVRYSEPSSTSFTLEGSSLHINPLPAPGSASGWIMDATNSSNCKIYKKLLNGTNELVIGSTIGNLVYVGSTDIAYSLSVADSVATTSTLFSIMPGELITVLNTGTFYDSIIGTVGTGGVFKWGSFNTPAQGISSGLTTRTKDGQYWCNYYSLTATISNGNLTLKAGSRRDCSGSAMYGTFSGTIKILKFSIH